MSDDVGCDSQLTGLKLSDGFASLPILHDIQAYGKLRKVEFMFFMSC
jgi:hypothetical protein